jgi:[ribosomal protein S18]-alanine N-acetyltransferase
MTIRFGFMEKKGERCGARKLRPAHRRVRIDYAEEVYARSWHNAVMTPRAISIRPAEPRDAQAVALMSRDFIEAGLGWKYDAGRVMRAIRDRETLAVVACESGKSGTRGAINGFGIMEFGDERAHLVLLAVRPSHRRLGIGQRLLDWMLESARVAGMASIHLELRSGNEAARRFYRAMGFYETVLVPGYYRSGEGRKEGALRMLRVLRAPGPVPFTWRPPKTSDNT